MKRIKAMKRAWKIGMIFGVFICTILSSCYDKIDDFDILSGTEYVIERGTDTTIYIQTKGYNTMHGIYIDTDEVHFMYHKKKYPIHNSYDSLLYVTYFSEPDTTFVKSINSSFMYITNLSDNPKDNQPVYKAEIKNKHTSGVHQIILSLGSNMAEHRIYFNIK